MSSNHGNNFLCVNLIDVLPVSVYIALFCVHCAIQCFKLMNAYHCIPTSEVISQVTIRCRKGVYKALLGKREDMIKNDHIITVDP